MPPSQLRRRSISALGNAGELLQTLKPAAFATMLCVDSDEYRNQGEIATAIGCNQSTISVHLTSLSDLPMPLVQKEGHPYVVTEAGENIVDLIDGMATRLGVDLHTITWANPDEKETVEELFAPLYNSRSALPFFVLWALGVLSGAIDLLQTTQPVAFETLITAVEDLYQDREQRVSDTQVSKALNDRFVPANVVDFDKDNSSLTRKGREHARLIDRTAELFEEYYSGETAQENTNGLSTTSTTPDTNTIPSPAETLTTKTPAQQAIPQLFRASARPPVDDSAEDTSHSPPPLLPAYCLSHPTDAADRSLPTPVLPLTSRTATELAEAVTRLTTMYDADAQLDLYWTIQTEDGLIPVAPQISPDPDTQEER